jgi:hypothetical protein
MLVSAIKAWSVVRLHDVVSAYVGVVYGSSAASTVGSANVLRKCCQRNALQSSGTERASKHEQQPASEGAMARRMSKTESKALGALLTVGLVVGLPIYLAGQLGEILGWPLLIALVVAAMVAVIWGMAARSNARRAELLSKYGDPDTVERIMRRMYWQGQTAEQLRDSLGSPVDTDQKALKTKTREIWKYHQRAANRFGLRITVENTQWSSAETRSCSARCSRKPNH